MFQCKHCQDSCQSDTYRIQQDVFCCLGCKSAYLLLKDHDLEDYYQLEEQARIQPEEKQNFDHFKDDLIQKKVLLLDTDKTQKIQFHLPKIHCISCVWLLERLYKINSGILKSHVQFNKKEIQITFLKQQTSIKVIAELLDRLGYTPEIIDSQQSHKKADRQKILKLTVAAICFGNIMLFSFPSYFGLRENYHYFQWFNFLFSLPVFFYCGSDYAKSFFTFLKTKQVSLDIPIYIGMLALFGKSCYDLYLGTHGYWDSLAGLIFFLLLGRFFQESCFEKLSFDRDYKSFFPFWTQRVQVDSLEHESVAIDRIKINDHIWVRHQEIVPCDGLLLSESILLDYSFVSGESEAIECKKSESIYAGAKVMNSGALIQVTKESERSYLTSLWSDFAPKHSITTSADHFSKFFTPAVLCIATLCAYFSTQPLTVFTTICIIACPCALALASPLVLGFASKHFANLGLYFKNGNGIESLSKIKHCVFDKTGTLSLPQNTHWHYEGFELSHFDKEAIASLCNQSMHPASQNLKDSLGSQTETEVNNFHEVLGKGIQATIKDHTFRLGSPNWIQGCTSKIKEGKMNIAIEVDGSLKGLFSQDEELRPGILKMLINLNRSFSLLSGDKYKENHPLHQVVNASQCYYQQSPQDKLKFIRDKNTDIPTAMVGDGLNDSGALRESSFGIAVVEDKHAFSPASDALLQGPSITRLPEFLKASIQCVHLIHFAFLISISYNAVGIYLAATEVLTPLSAAILMPISSVSILLTAYLGNSLIFRPLNRQIVCPLS